MKKAQQWFDEYGVSHQNPTNKLIHWVCVPAIFFSVVGMLSAIPVPFLANLLGERFAHAGTILILVGSIFYLTMSIGIFIGMLLVSFLMLMGVNALSTIELAPVWVISLIIFVVAWIGQFVGHNIEGAKPSFFKDLLFLLVGPAWLLGFVYKRLGIPY